MTRIFAMVATTILTGAIAATPTAAAAAPEKKPAPKTATAKSVSTKAGTRSKAAKHHPGDVTRAQMKAQANAIFDRADTNHDGFLSMAEFRVRMNAIINRAPPGGKPPSRKDVQTQYTAAVAAFHHADTNGDGKLNRVEGTRRPLAAFDMMDANHDGILTLKEKKAALDAPSAQVVGPVQR